MAGQCVAGTHRVQAQVNLFHKSSHWSQRWRLLQLYTEEMEDGCGHTTLCINTKPNCNHAHHCTTLRLLAQSLTPVDVCLKMIAEDFVLEIRLRRHTCSEPFVESRHTLRVLMEESHQIIRVALDIQAVHDPFHDGAVRFVNLRALSGRCFRPILGTKRIVG